MIGREELTAVMKNPPVDLDWLDDMVPEEERQAEFEKIYKAFWESEGVDYDAVSFWGHSAGAIIARQELQGIEMTIEDFYEIARGFASAHLTGFLVGWMCARGMGSHADH